MSLSEVEIRLPVGGEVRGIPVAARARWNSTGVHVNPGERYAMAAAGRWTDLSIETDADGFPSDAAPRAFRGFMREHEGRRRMPDARWFCLIGAVGELGSPFRIGATTTWTVPEAVAGPLLCYANDVPSAYWNNRGALRLRVTRIA